MAKKINAKLVVELLGKGMSGREIARTRHIAPQSVRKVREAAEAKGVSWEDAERMDEREVYDLLFPGQAEEESACMRPDYDYVHKELRRDGVTLLILYAELRDRAAEGGLACKSYGTFCRGYRDYVVAKNVTNHLEHKPGQVMEVDWNGTTMSLFCEATGEVATAYLFVACLPYSQYSYVEATLDMKQNTWLMCHVHAWEFFGGVAVRTVCDNLKVGVVKHPRDGEVVLNEAYEALGRHYMTAIMPTGVRKPKQKASVEGTCGKVAPPSPRACATSASRPWRSSTPPSAGSSTSSTRPPSRSAREAAGSCSKRSGPRSSSRCRRCRSRSARGCAAAPSASTSTSCSRRTAARRRTRSWERRSTSR